MGIYRLATRTWFLVLLKRVLELLERKGSGHTADFNPPPSLPPCGLPACAQALWQHCDGLQLSPRVVHSCL